MYFQTQLAVFRKTKQSEGEIVPSVVHSTQSSWGWLPPNDWQMKQTPWGGVKLLNNEPAKSGNLREGRKRTKDSLKCWINKLIRFYKLD